MRNYLIFLSLMTCGFYSSGLAASSTPSTGVKCGNYFVKIESGDKFGDPSYVSLILNNKTYVKLEDVHVDMDFCKDVTNDGVPEVMLMQHSGGAHCCAVHSLYSLTVPPRRILYNYSADSLEMSVQQLDGKGPLEIIGEDWRFAYAYGLSFAGSPALPRVFTYKNGHYMADTRSYPGLVLGRTVHSGTESLSSGTYLHDYAALLLVGKPNDAATFLKTIPLAQRQWLENYAPDIRQRMLDYDMWDWPRRAGEAEKALQNGIGGAFSNPGTREYLALIGQKDSSIQLRLFAPQNGQIVSSPILKTFRLKPKETYSDLEWTPVFTVSRRSGRDDAVIREGLIGNVAYSALRINPNEAVNLQNDPLTVALAMLGDLTTLANHTASQFDATPRSAAQRAEASRITEAALSKAAPWMDRSNSPFELQKLGYFEVQALSLPIDSPDVAQVSAPVEFGLISPNQADPSVRHSRYTITINLKKGLNGWEVTDWDLKNRRENLPNP